jgi:SPP1 gp7 family putative phage head morphogenesis protein
MYKPNQLRGSKGGLFQRLGRGSTDARNALRPPEPRAAELIYRSWVRAFWKLWAHAVRTELVSVQQRGMSAPDFAGRMYALLNASGLNGVLTRTGQSVCDLVARYMGSIFKPGAHVPAGVRLDAAFESIPRLRPFNAEQAALIDKWRLENLRLIKNATDEHIAALFKVFKDAQEQGIAHGELAGMVDQVLNGGFQRAMLIASDQTTKFNGTIQQVQQTAAGITEFVWSTSHDGAVRPTHRELDGKKFKWAVGAPDGPNLVLPGQPVRCRCQAIPVIELFAGID